VADGQGKNILLRATTGRLAVAGHNVGEEVGVLEDRDLHSVVKDNFTGE
jgi:hypothetical protein